MTVFVIAVVVFVTAAITLLVVTTRPSKQAVHRQALTSRISAINLTEPSRSPAIGSGSVLEKVRVRAEVATADVLTRRNSIDRINASLRAAGWKLTAEQWVLANALLAVAGATTMFLLAGGSLGAAVFGLAVGAGIPALVLKTRKAKRRDQFVLDLPEVLTSMASALKAGQSTVMALESSASESSGAMADELSQVLIDHKLGMDLGDALSAAAARTDSEELAWVAVTIKLQQQHGGALADLLGEVAATMRERVALRRQVATLSAEGRLSIIVLMALPVVMLGFLAVARPEYFAFFLSGFGIILLATCALMMTCGYLWAKAITKVEV